MPIVIADRLLDFNGITFKLENAALRGVYVAKAILEADKVIALTYFTGTSSSALEGRLKILG